MKLSEKKVHLQGPSLRLPGLLTGPCRSESRIPRPVRRPRCRPHLFGALVGGEVEAQVAEGNGMNGWMERWRVSVLRSSPKGELRQHTHLLQC